MLCCQAVPKLIDNKRKHLERNLSAAQRDKIFMKDLKSDNEFRQELIQSMKESNDSFNESVRGINQSIAGLTQSLSSSMELLSRSLCNLQPPAPPQIPFHQNMFYQNIHRGSVPDQVEQPQFYSQLLSNSNISDENVLNNGENSF